MVRIIWLVNGLTIIAVTSALVFQSNEVVFDFLAVATKVCLAVSYAALSWATARRSPELETAVLAYLTVVYLCVALHLLGPAYLTYTTSDYQSATVSLGVASR